MATLTLQSIGFSFPERVLFSDLCLNAKNAALVIGHNGVGKTTLLRIVAHLIPPVSGSILLNQSTNYTSSVFFTPSALLETNSVVDHIKWATRWTESASVAEALSLSGLESLASHDVCKLSRGQKQILALTLSCLMPADMLVADEPFAHLDEQTRERACLLLKRASLKRFVLVASTQKESLPFDAELWNLG